MLLAAPAGPTTVRCETNRSLSRKRERTARGTGADGWTHDGGCAPPAADCISLWIGRTWRRIDQMSGRLIGLVGVGRVAGTGRVLLLPSPARYVMLDDTRGETGLGTD